MMMEKAQTRDKNLEEKSRNDKKIKTWGGISQARDRK